MINKFECCGKIMITVIIDKIACVMLEMGYNRMIEAEWKYYKRNHIESV